MQTPLVFRAILGLLMDLAIPAALGAFVMAGMRLGSLRWPPEDSTGNRHGIGRALH